MPNPGKPRLGTSQPVDLAGVNAAYFDLYGNAEVTINGAVYDVEGNRWKSVNVLPGQLCVASECRKLGTAEAFSVRIAPTDGVVSNIQHYTDGSWLREAGGKALLGADGGSALSVNEWGRLAQSLYFDAVIVADALGMCGKFEMEGCAEIRESAPKAALRALDTIAQWPFWGPYEEGGEDWDQGSWSLGYLPAAVAIYASMPGVEFDISDSWGRIVADHIDSEEFPPVQHWIRRSTNHAAVIYGGLIGGSLIKNNCRHDAFSRRMLDEFEEMSAGSFADGFYLESSSYASVYLYNSVFGAIVLAACDEQPLGGVFEDYYAGHLQAVAENAALISGPDGGRWLDYGDASRSRWNSNVQIMFANYSAFWKGVPISPLPMSVPGIVERIKAVTDDIRPDQARFCNVFEDAGVAVMGDERARIGVLSMPLHLTHNKDYDLGAMTLAVDGVVVIGPNVDATRPVTRAATSHSTSWIEPADEACFGKNPECGGRRMHGAIRAGVQSDDMCVVSAQGNDKHLHRVFAVKQADGGLYVTIFDVADLDDGESIYVNLADDAAPEKVAIRREALEMRGKTISVTQLWTGGVCPDGPIVSTEGATAHIRACDGSPLMAVPLNDITRRP